jgi:hypothetical protein
MDSSVLAGADGTDGHDGIHDNDQDQETNGDVDQHKKKERCRRGDHG